MAPKRGTGIFTVATLNKAKREQAQTELRKLGVPHQQTDRRAIAEGSGYN